MELAAGCEGEFEDGGAVCVAVHGVGCHYVGLVKLSALEVSWWAGEEYRAVDDVVSEPSLPLVEGGVVV